MQILERRNEFVYNYTHERKVQRSRKLRLPKMIWMFRVHTQNSHCNLSETSLEFTSGLEFEFVIVISICDSNLLTQELTIRH